MISRFNLGLVLILIFSTAQPAVPPVVETESGFVRGTQEEDVTVFRGIPFAATTAGENRWRPPRPPAAWDGVRPADRFGPICPQNLRPELSFDITVQSEDCLSLNIWTLQEAGPEKLPVMVWVYGGNFRSGAGSWPNYGGTRLARKGVVVVTFNYRLGYLGLFAHPSLNKTRLGEPIANYALMDQIAALKWVQRNIAAFGGDPAKVTIFGESAGGVSVNFLLASPATKGLFHRAISQSGGIRIDRTRRLDERILMYRSLYAEAKSLMRFANIPDDTSAGRKLQALAVQTILDYARNQISVSLNPVVDGRIIPDDVGTIFRQGRQQPVPLLIGSNTWEASIPVRSGMPVKVFLIGHDREALTKLYGPLDDVQTGNQIFADQAMAMPAHYLAGKQAALGQPAYLYLFGYVSEGLRATVPGVAHAAEIAYVFQTLDQFQWGSPADMPVSDTDRAFSEIVSDYWVAFARRGNPNGPGRPEWPVYTPDDDVLLELGEVIVPRRDYLKARLDYHRDRAEEAAVSVR